MHIQRHKHTSTHVQSAHKRNGDNQAQEPEWEGQKKGFDRDLAHKNVRKTRLVVFTNQKKRFEHIQLPAKLLDYFLRSNKSNINQCRCCIFGRIDMCSICTSSVTQCRRQAEEEERNKKAAYTSCAECRLVKVFFQKIRTSVQKYPQKLFSTLYLVLTLFLQDLYFDTTIWLAIKTMNFDIPSCSTVHVLFSTKFLWSRTIYHRYMYLQHKQTTRSHTHTHTYINICEHSREYMYTNLCVSMHTHTHTNTRIHTRTHNTYTHIHARTHIHIHTHTTDVVKSWQVWKFSLLRWLSIRKIHSLYSSFFMYTIVV